MRVYRAGGADPGIAVRVIVRRPDRIGDFGETRIVSETMIFDVRASEIAAPAEGDTLDVDGVTYVIQGKPMRDAERLIWTIEARPCETGSGHPGRLQGGDDRRAACGTGRHRRYPRGDGWPEGRPAAADHRRRPGRPPGQHLARRGLPEGAEASAPPATSGARRRGSSGCMRRAPSSARSRACSSPSRRRRPASSAMRGRRSRPAPGSASTACGSVRLPARRPEPARRQQRPADQAGTGGGEYRAAAGGGVHPAGRPHHRAAVHPGAAGDGAEAPGRRRRGEKWIRTLPQLVLRHWFGSA